MGLPRPCSYPAEKSPGLVAVAEIAAPGFAAVGGVGVDVGDPDLAAAAGIVVGPTACCASWTERRRSAACCERCCARTDWSRGTWDSSHQMRPCSWRSWDFVEQLHTAADVDPVAVPEQTRPAAFAVAARTPGSVAPAGKAEPAAVAKSAGGGVGSTLSVVCDVAREEDQVRVGIAAFGTAPTWPNPLADS